MADTKHPAEVLADDAPYVAEDTKARAWVGEAESWLRLHPALEAERNRYRVQRDRAEADAILSRNAIRKLEAERDQLRAEVDALREANSTFASASILPDDKVIADRAEVDALRADAERMEWLEHVAALMVSANHYGMREWLMKRPAGAGNLRAAIDAARKDAP